MAIADAHGRFLYYDIGANGVVGDAAIWMRSKLRFALHYNCLNIPNPRKLPGSEIIAPYVFVADDAFQLENYMMKPYNGRNLSQEQLNFNYFLSRSRQQVECAFGMLASKFQIFQKPLNVDIKKAIKYVESSICLHNWLRTESIQSGIPDETTNVNYNTFNDCLNETQPQISNKSTSKAENVRNDFKSYITQIGISNLL